SVNVIVIKEVVANCNEQTKVLHNPQDRTQETIVKKFDKQTSEKQKSSFDKSRRTKTRTTSHSNHPTSSEVTRNCHSQVTADSHSIETPYNTNSSNTYKETVSRDSEITTDEIIKRGLNNAIPSEIYNVLSPHFGGQELYDIYGILLRAKAAIDRSITLEVHADKFMTVFYNVKALYKAGKVRKSLRGLLYASWERLSAEISRQEAAVAMGVM